MSDRVTEIMEDLAERKRLKDQSEYDFFFSAPLDTQEQVYRYWIKNKDINTAPAFLKDYAKSKEPTPPIFLWPPVPF